METGNNHTINAQPESNAIGEEGPGPAEADRSSNPSAQVALDGIKKQVGEPQPPRHIDRVVDAVEVSYIHDITH